MSARKNELSDSIGCRPFSMTLTTTILREKSLKHKRAVDHKKYESLQSSAQKSQAYLYLSGWRKLVHDGPRLEWAKQRTQVL